MINSKKTLPASPLSMPSSRQKGRK